MAWILETLTSSSVAFLTMTLRCGQGMNPFMTWLSLMLWRIRACDGGAFTAIAQKGEVFPWTKTDGRASHTKTGRTGVRIGSDRTLLNQRAGAVEACFLFFFLFLFNRGRGVRTASGGRGSAAAGAATAGSWYQRCRLRRGGHKAFPSGVRSMPAPSGQPSPTSHQSLFQQRAK